MSKVDCIFCHLHRDRAKEHVWPRWLQKRINGDTKSLFQGTHLSPLMATTVSKRVQSGETLVLGNVCSVCNNGWMASMESKFSAILNKIGPDYNYLKTINKNDRNDFALWAFKTAIIINAAANYRKIVPSTHYNQLYQHRTVAKNVKVDIGIIQIDRGLEWVQSPLSFKIVNSKDTEKEKLLPEQSSYSIAIQIKNLGIRVSFFENAKQDGFEILPIAEEKEIRVWPYRKKSSFDFSNPYEDIHAFQLGVFLKKQY